MACAFCDIANVVAQEIVVVEHARVWSPLEPITAAHLMVMPLRHVERYRDLAQDEVLSLDAAVRAAMRLIEAAIGASAMNIALNDGPEAGQSVPHLHAHVWGRVAHDPTTNPFPVLNGQRPPPARVTAVAEVTRRWRALLR